VFLSFRKVRASFQHGRLCVDCSRILLTSMFFAAVLGCGGGEEIGLRLIPVSGVVKIDGKPLTTGGSVSYRDATGLVQPTGKIAGDGTYELFLDRQAGAPAGQYRVIVFASEPRPETAGHGGLPRLIIDEKYTHPDTTPLRVEVKDNAASGDYDLTVTRRPG
jgi:hypothetical protein